VNVAVRKPSMSLDQFLAWGHRQDGRWEFDVFEPRAIVGAYAEVGDTPTR
jgi:hypothetical protein